MSKDSQTASTAVDGAPTKGANFRDYENASDTVKALYRQNHVGQTLAFVMEQKKKYLPLHYAKMSIWDMLAKLDGLIDESDPDTAMPQTVHALQSAEAARRDGQPRWFILTCLIHDLGKVLFFMNEPQWAVVGDTFPVGCKFSDKIVYAHEFQNNPDYADPIYSTQFGIYAPNCGFDNLHMSWGHDEYLYQIIKANCPNFPVEAAYIIRFHSFYPAHREGAYEYLMSAHDHAMKKWLLLFNQYDLYTKASDLVSLESVAPFYKELILEFFPENVQF